MGLEANGVADLGIRRHLGTSVAASPLLGKLNKAASDAHFPIRLVHEPTLEITDVVSVTVLDMRPNARLEKADQTAFACISNRNKLGLRVLDDLGHLVHLVVLIRTVPQRSTQAEPFGKVALRERSYSEG